MKANFIKTPGPFQREFAMKNDAPLFRRSFTVSGEVVRATLACTGLGYGYFYINGKAVAPDRLTAPVSNYTKTVWYTEYDVTALLNEGENVAAAILGNGLYNEALSNPFNFYKAEWRDKPKMIFSLTIEYADHTEIVESDAQWKCTDISPVVYNQLRSGEYYDARLYQKGWNEVGFDDSSWQNAVMDDTPPTGVLRKCECEPICEFKVYSPIEVRCTGEGRYLFRFEQNMSGYIALRTGSLSRGQTLTIRYAEAIKEDGSLDFHKMDDPYYYPESRFATDEFTADGEDFVWSPRFTYHGFCYIQIEGLTEEPASDLVSAVFVHQAIEQRTEFSCSDERLNQLFHMGIYSTWSNMFYMPTDCPTREKMGWGNDTQSSIEQFLIDFGAEKVMTKWFTDICDSLREDGAVPAIIPTGGWGFEWGTGPTTSGVLFELPAQVYRYTGDDSLLIAGLPYFERHLEYIISRTDENGLINYGLCDWAGPWDHPEGSPTPLECSNMLLYIKFLRITEFAAQRAGNAEAEKRAATELARATKLVLDTYFNDLGAMNVPHQCALSMVIMLDICPDLEVAGKQLVEAVERDNRHLNCGMVGLRYLFRALDKIGRSDLAYAIVTAEGSPSYMEWVTERKATTLCELWHNDWSQNHHMYSEVLAWMVKTIGGINNGAPGFKKCIIRPYFAPELDWCRVQEKTLNGTVSAYWRREDGKVLLDITVPEGMEAEYNGKALQTGINSFSIAQ
ncbi:MAG: hypothetical protein E7409_07595 [Ruminococcaceae bacterium]|nr:hypothetical protein [Oscillospiraceae bacterium]